MKKISLIIIAIFLFSSTMFAQTTGTLRGTVSGPDGAIPGAKVVVKDNKTGRELNIQASDDGSFVVPQLDFGTYTVTVTAPGFKTSTTNDLKIDTGREFTLNPALEVGGIEEVVTVNAGTDIINASNAELSNTVGERQVIDLPINGRNPLALVSLQAGANATSQSVSGQRSTAINITRDGVNIQDQFIRTGPFVPDLPTVDDTGEFTVTTQNANASQGGGGSTQVQLVTPRGGREIHGAAFIFNRNSAFAANNFFNNSAGIPNPFLNRNQIGGKFSGPLPTPNFGEGGPVFRTDKAVFFVAYEKLIQRQQATPTNTVLLGTARDGTFTYTDDSGVSRSVNVLTGAGFDLSTPGRQQSFVNAGGVLSVDPVVQSRLLSLIPTVGNSGLPRLNGLVQDFRFNVRDNRDRDSFVSRVDVDINESNSMNFVYRFVRDIDDRPDANVGFDAAPFVIADGDVHIFSGAYRKLFGSRFTNEVRFGFRKENPFFNQDPNMNTNFLILGPTATTALPLGVTTPESTFQDQGRNTKQWSVRDDAAYAWGNHAITFGGLFESQAIDVISNFSVIPEFGFTSTLNTNTPRLATALFPGGISAAQRTNADNLRYLLGGIIGFGQIGANPTSSTSGPILGNPAIERLRWDVINLYVSDQWRIHPTLTVNLGLRYDLFTPLTNPDQILLEPVIPAGVNVVDAILNPNGSYDFVGTSLGKPGQLFKSDKNNFGPVIGFAWAPKFKNGFLGTLFGDGKTTIRGGYRASFINDEYLKAPLNAARGNDGLSFTVEAVDIINGNPTTDINRRLQNITGGGFPPAPFVPPPFTFATANANDPSFFNSVFAVTPDMQTPKTHEYNIGIQRELGGNMALEIRYVGGRSDSLVRAFDFNQVNIRDTGFADDFLRAQNNCRLQAAAIGATGLNCTNAAFNPAIAGSVPLPVFNQLPFGAFLNNSAVITQLQNGTPGALAETYITAGADIDENGSGVQFRANPKAGVVDLAGNFGKYRYNALQAEVRRRFSNGFYFQANYTFQKTLTDVPEEDQNRFDPYLDVENPSLEYSRADFDRAHAFNFNGIYELPFGQGKQWLNDSGWVDKVFGGWQVSSIIQYVTGAPLSFRDPRGTLNRTARSTRQTAVTTLSKEGLKDLVGIFRTPNGVFFIDPSVIGPNGSATNGNPQATPSNPAFPGQVFFNVPPGTTSTLERAFINGPDFFTVDVGLGKRIRFSEKYSLQLRAEAFNVFNRANFRPVTGAGTDGALGENSNLFNINSNTFGRITTTFPPRIMQFGARFEF